MSKVYIGIDVGGTKTAYGLFNGGFELLDKIVEPTNIRISPDGFMDGMRDCVQGILSRSGASKDELVGIGMCFPSNIVYDQGYIYTTSNMPQMVGVHLVEGMERRLGVPVKLDNDANVAAAAEHFYGAGRGRRNMIYVTISTGVGGGLILNNQLFRGDDGFAGEIGHILVSDTLGYTCGCGNTGCCESICSGPYLERYARQTCGEDSLIAWLAGGRDKITPVHIGQALAQGDELARELVTRDADYIARMFASLFHVLNVNTVVYGGGLVKIGPLLIDEMKAAFARYTSKVTRSPVEFLPAQLKDDVGIRGAVLLVDKY